MSRAPRQQAGFTLMELMISMAITSLVAAMLYASFANWFRLIQISFAEAELSINTRSLRERLLYHAAPAHDNTVWAGLLSGTNTHAAIEGNGEKILLHCTALRGGRVYEGTEDQTIEVVFRDSGTGQCRLFSEDRYDERWNERWLHPGRTDFFAGSPTPSDIFVSDSHDPGRFYINVTARKTIAGFTVEHNERIVVPIAGRTQRSEPDGTGGLGR